MASSGKPIIAEKKPAKASLKAGEKYFWCGHDQLSKLSQSDLTTWKEDMARLSGVVFGGVK